MSLTFDPLDPEFVADPFPLFARLREEEPVHWSPALGGWVLTRFADVKSALADPRLSASRVVGYFERLSEEDRRTAGELAASLVHWAVFNDPPRHTRLRGLLNKAFTPQAIERLRPRIERATHDLLDKAANPAGLDIVADLAYPLPVIIIGEMIGVPSEDIDHFKHWSDELALFVGSAVSAPDRRERADRSLREINAYMRGVIADHRARPREDLMTALIEATDRGDALTEDELVASCVMLLFAGHETTTNLIANGFLALLRHPDQLTRLRGDLSLVKPAVEEFLRYDGPVQAMVRLAKEEVAFEGGTVRPGDRVFCMINAANRDPARFEEPDRLDVGRRDNPHIAFGHGIHFCLGAPLARVEAQAALEIVLRRFPTMRLESGGIEWRETLVMRGPKRLAVTTG